MIDPATYKSACLGDLHERLHEVAEVIRLDTRQSDKKKAQSINALIKAERDRLLASLPDKEGPQLRIVAEYCISVVSLEYRNLVWRYDYMALSRRVGELWERTCRAAWDSPSNAALTAMTPPEFSEISQDIRARMSRLIIPGMEREAEAIISQMLGLIGNVNMKSDGVFRLHDQPLIVDFKSGFGSNEKGNMERLQRVGQAYRAWRPDSRLLLLVRQNDHNAHYLNTLAQGQDWEVHCGSEAYDAMRNLTGVDVGGTLSQAVDFETDLSADFWKQLRLPGKELDRYLDWSGG